MPGARLETTSVVSCGGSRHGCAKAVILQQEDAGTASKDEAELLASARAAAFSLAESSILSAGHLVVFLHLLRPEESANLIPGLFTNLSVHPGGFFGRPAKPLPSRLHDPANLGFLVGVQIQSLIQALEEPRTVAADLSRLSRRRPSIRSATGMEVRRPGQDMGQDAADEAAREEYEDDPEDGLSSIRQ